MAKVVDARGLSCPQPVILTRKALEEAEEVTVIVDNPVAKENVKRMGESQGCEVRVEECGDGIYLHFKRRRSEPLEVPEVARDLRVVVLCSEGMGRGEDELGKLLMRAFLHTLSEIRPGPRRIVLFNTGVKLAVEGSEVLGDLRALEEKGVEILVCGTCLDYFGLKEKVAVGRISNMYEIAETLLSASGLVTV